jgi:hypothetical protein
MNEFMLWVETYLTYENMVMMANVLSTVAIGGVLIWKTFQNTKQTLLKNTDIVNNVNKSVGNVVNKSVVRLSEDIVSLREDNKKILEALILSMAGDAESRLAAIKLISQSKVVDKTVVVQAEERVEDEILVEKVNEVIVKDQKEEINAKISILEDTL